MFTGIVEEAGMVQAVTRRGKGWSLEVEAGAILAGVKIGDSVAVSGCCLTVTEVNGKRLVFDLLDETKEKTNLQSVQVGARVNLESSLKADGKLGGHFVTGHIDGTAQVMKWVRSGEDWELEAEVPSGLERYLVPKGCVAIDGISLTLGRVEGRKFNVWIIPHTYEVTTLRDRKEGEKVNLECDLLAKYVEKMTGAKK
ncbi:MAG: riboflavin synthase [Verrucomicrobia bacterium]|jgi:riboflavin synthase|nr:riboflavin synthase [Verrucomicrobiota bacterium]